MKNDESDDWWEARKSAIEGALGKAEEVVGHAPIPFDLGADIGGAADVMYFRARVPGVVAVTAELIGRNDQIPNRFGNYELMICGKEDVEWGAGIISRLAHYTLEVEINAGETMDIGPSAPDGSTIAAFMFFEYARFAVRDRPCGLLLCVGITKDELEMCQQGRGERVETALKAEGVYPYTDLFRASTLDRTGKAG